MRAMKMVPGALVSIGAAVTAGIAAWLSRASFDVAGSTASPLRVAMLPSVAELMGLMVLSLLIAAGIASVLGGKKDIDPFWTTSTDAMVPLFALSLLVVPYLPWIPDWLPALRLLAGPGRLLIWSVVIGQVLWIVLPRLRRRLGLPSPLISASKGAALFGIVSVAGSAPFVLNVRSFAATLNDFFDTVRGLPSATLSSLPAGILGVLFDQEYGIFIYAPVLLLSVFGLLGMLRARSQRGLGAILAIIVLALILVPATVDPWWSKSMMPGRPLFLLLPFLGIPIAWLYARLEPGSPARAAAQVLLLVSVVITLTFVAFTPRVPALQEGDGSSALLQWLSPTWQLWREAPTYVAGVSKAAMFRLGLWLTSFGIAAAIFARRATPSEGRAALLATVSAAALFLTGVTLSATVVPDATRGFDAESRVLFPLLETFDPVARPIAVRYDGFSRVRPDELPPLFALSAVPEQRKDRQPVRVVLNARFRLPAGKYMLGLKGSELAGSVPNPLLALQIGREGRPIETWPVTLGRGERMQREFDVPLDAEFVGFRAPRPVEQTIAELRVSPLSVVETRKRVPAGTVLSAAQFPPARVFFHDSNAYPESEGFWVKGRSTVRMTLLKVREDDLGVLLAIHCGARPNAVTLATPAWSQTLELMPGLTRRVTVPSNAGERFIPLTISSTNGFVPAEVEGGNDSRLLGAWIAFIRDDIAKTSAVP
jgi:hypothetical protein